MINEPTFEYLFGEYEAEEICSITSGFDEEEYNRALGKTGEYPFDSSATIIKKLILHYLEMHKRSLAFMAKYKITDSKDKYDAFVKKHTDAHYELLLMGAVEHIDCDIEEDVFPPYHKEVVRLLFSELVLTLEKYDYSIENLKEIVKVFFPGARLDIKKKHSYIPLKITTFFLGG